MMHRGFGRSRPCMADVHGRTIRGPYDVMRMDTRFSSFPAEWARVDMMFFPFPLHSERFSGESVPALIFVAVLPVRNVSVACAAREVWWTAWERIRSPSVPANLDGDGADPSIALARGPTAPPSLCRGYPRLTTRPEVARCVQHAMLPPCELRRG